MTNPFKYGKEVTGYLFYDRVQAADELYRHLRDGTTSVAISAPRRSGKTSLAMKVLERFRQEGARCLHFDVSKVGSAERFCEEYAAERRNGREVERGDIDFAVTRLLENGEDLYAEILPKLSSCQRALLEALAAEPAAKFDGSCRSRHALGNVSTLHSSRCGLIEQGLVEQEDGRYKVGDPFFARYIQTASAARVLL